jgi:hypothetical protein
MAENIFGFISRFINKTVTVKTNKKIQFRDTGLYIQSDSDGNILISSDGTITTTATTSQSHTGATTFNSGVTFASTATISGAINVAGTAGFAGTADCIGNLKVRGDATLTGKATTQAVNLTAENFTTTGSANADTGYITMAGTAFTVTVPTPSSGKWLVIAQTAGAGGTANCPPGITFDGTNGTANFNAVNETLILFGVSATSYVVVENIGSVALA